MRGHTKSRFAGLWIGALLIVLVSGAAIALQTRFDAPPRYDGAGYATLATALLEGRGYRAIDHPDAPRHVHFPPGYPGFLSLVWSATGVSNRAAHLASMACAVGATLAAWLWFRRLYSPIAALGLGLALGVNWVWSRTGGGIQSEPLYMLLGQLAILAASGRWPRRWPLRGVLLGLLLGAAVLTRHVALGLIAAILIDQATRGRGRAALVAAVVVALVAAPWVVWVVSFGGGESQAGLLVEGGRSVFGGLADQGLFYMERLPDQLTGPFVEVATVFGGSRAVRALALAWAAVGSSLMVAGWLVALGDPRRRLAGLVALATLGLLLVWPYTEAGRFLIPLIPCLLVGSAEGFVWVLKRLKCRWTPRRLRVIAAWLVFCACVPYAGYAIATAERRARGEDQGAFDSACLWIRDRADRPGPVLTRHPGEVFLQTGRRALEVSTSERPGAVDADPAAVGDLIDRYAVAYLLVDDARYANAATSPLDRFVRERPQRARLVFSARDRRGSVRVYEAAR